MPAYLPSEERAEIIGGYAQGYATPTFVETGTADGATVAALLHHFEHVITIELDAGLYELAVQRFAPHPHVLCLHGDSGVVLGDVVPGLTGPATFWLDGHYCGGARGSIDTPIREELSFALLAPKGSVILIDDARLFGEMPEHTEEFADYPPVSWIEEKARGAGYNFALVDDIMRLTP